MPSSTSSTRHMTRVILLNLPKQPKKTNNNTIHFSKKDRTKKILIAKKIKKGEIVFGLIVYGRFLSRSNPTMAMAMIIATTPIAMYIIRSVVVAKLV
jgi:hypothetical protein